MLFQNDKILSLFLCFKRNFPYLSFPLKKNAMFLLQINLAFKF